MVVALFDVVLDQFVEFVGFPVHGHRGVHWLVVDLLEATSDALFFGHLPELWLFDDADLASLWNLIPIRSWSAPSCRRTSGTISRDPPVCLY